jgi:hypothetical protein
LTATRQGAILGRGESRRTGLPTTRGRLAGAALFVTVLVLYLATFSSVPVSDAYSWVRTIDTRDLYFMCLAGHPLPLYVEYTIKRLLVWLGTPVATLTIIQTVDAVLAATGAVLFSRLVRVLSGDRGLGLLGGALLATSFGYWYFANGEVHHFGLVFPLAIFLLVVERRRRGGRAPGFSAAMGALNAVGIMFHQDALLFGFAAVAMLLIDRPWREGVGDAAAYVASGSVTTAVLVPVIGFFVRELGSVRQVLQWYFWPTWAAGVSVYEIGGVTGSILRSLKAQLTAIAYGTQVLLDLAREPSVRTDGRSLVFAALTIVAYASMAGLLVALWRVRRDIRARFLVPFTGCVIWIVAYKVFLNSWFQPASTEYHVVSLPPLLLLLLLAPIAATSSSAARSATSRLTTATVVLVVALAVVNFWAAILPWREYGTMTSALAGRFQREVEAGDLFLSNESGIDAVFRGARGHVGIKDLLKEKGKVDGFRSLDALVEAQLRRGGRVFLYNLVPNAFTLRRINLVEPSRGADPLTYADFDRFMAHLKERYVLVPVFSYWEEAKIPLELYGRRFETIWEIRRA